MLKGGVGCWVHHRERLGEQRKELPMFYFYSYSYVWTYRVYRPAVCYSWSCF